ncbi:glycosyltransferase family 4 protein [Paramesorhizobium deserti]|nr:glycosyltransferase family 4 protein [Paramesorhizobium deserti]
MTSVNNKDVELIHASGLFDADWYLKEYPDVKALGIDPIKHYLWLGWRLKRNPSQKFDAITYFKIHSDVAAAGINPLLHYVKWGRRENRAFAPIPEKATARIANPSNARIIIYESHNLKLQGAPNSLFEIAYGIKKRGKFHPISMAPQMGPLAEAYRHNNIECLEHKISQFRLTSPAERDKWISNLANHYKNSGGTLAHVNTLQNFHCILAAHKAGIPSIWNIRESEDPETYYDYLPRDLRQIAYSCFSKASAVVFVAEATRSKWRSRLDNVVENLTVLNGIDITRLMRFVYGTNRPSLRASLGISEDDVLLLSVGTVSPRKGQQDLIDSLKHIDETTKQRTVLAIAGMNESQYSRNIREQLDDLSKQGLRVISVQESASEAERRKIAELYLAADVFVMNSRIESYPRVILEAMEFGLAIISTPCFGVKEQLVDKESGLFYDEGDIEKLHDHLRLLCNKPEERRRLGLAARKRLSSLNSYDQMLEAYEALYERILAAHQANS